MEEISVERRPSFWYSNHARIHRITKKCNLIIANKGYIEINQRLYVPWTKFKRQRGGLGISIDREKTMIMVRKRGKFQNFLEVNIFESHRVGPVWRGPSFTVVSSVDPHSSAHSESTHLNYIEAKSAGLEKTAACWMFKKVRKVSEKVIAIISVHGPPARVASNKRCQVACLIKSALQREWGDQPWNRASYLKSSPVLHKSWGRHPSVESIPDRQTIETNKN